MTTAKKTTAAATTPKLNAEDAIRALIADLSEKIQPGSATADDREETYRAGLKSSVETIQDLEPTERGRVIHALLDSAVHIMGSLFHVENELKTARTTVMNLTATPDQKTMNLYQQALKLISECPAICAYGLALKQIASYALENNGIGQINALMEAFHNQTNTHGLDSFAALSETEFNELVRLARNSATPSGLPPEIAQLLKDLEKAFAPNPASNAKTTSAS